MIGFDFKDILVGEMLEVMDIFLGVAPIDLTMAALMHVLVVPPMPVSVAVELVTAARATMTVSVAATPVTAVPMPFSVATMALTAAAPMLVFVASLCGGRNRVGGTNARVGSGGAHDHLGGGGWR